ncbi:hypothetical protein [Marixanthomonas spongiae]|uniref:Uncharacterized protein n=1 Tax=Marixanthomonas spongiae TaxID=2174845 RepID=A0A2U0I588_9FLAO|nr:hypothetical protein [Marixanthomonas spongiae]PVW16234.1 hypothetical protein DDV96_02895 [Marixanthomonas spongiae]
MKNKGQIILEEMRKLIKKSCDADMMLNPHYYSFQKSLLKFFFNAASVSIDRSKKTITLYGGAIVDHSPRTLYNINQLNATTISYTNLEETLKGCLEKTDKAKRFYKSQLFHYNNVAQVDTEDAISA